MPTCLTSVQSRVGDGGKISAISIMMHSLYASVRRHFGASIIRICFEAGGCTHPQSIHYSWKGVEMRGRAFRPLSNCLDVSRSIVRDEAVEPMDWRRRLPLRLSNFMLPQQSAVDRGMKT